MLTIRGIPEVDTAFKVTIRLYTDENYDAVGVMITSRTEIITVPAGVIDPASGETPEEWALDFLETVMREELDDYGAVAIGDVDDYTEYHWMVDNKAPALPLIIGGGYADY